MAKTTQLKEELKLALLFYAIDKIIRKHKIHIKMGSGIMKVMKIV